MATTTRSFGHRQYLWGLSTGIFVLAIAGGVWFSMAASVAEPVPSWTWTLTELAILAGIGLVAWAGVRVRRMADGFSLGDLEHASPAARARARRIQRGFLWVSLLEGVLVGLSFFLCGHFHRDDLKWAGMALAVSLHFLPLARLVRVRPYYWTTGAGSLVSLAALVVPRAALSAATRTTFVGLGMGAVVWMTAAYVTLRADWVGRVWDDAGEPAVKKLSKNTAYWTCQVLGWGAYSAVGLWSAAQQIGWRPALIANYILYFFYSIALTDQLRREMHRRHRQSAPAARKWAPFLVGAAVIGAIQTFLIVALDLALEGRASAFVEAGAFTAPVLFTLLGTTAITVVWVVLYVGFTAKRRREEKEAELLLALREAELRALEAQINPHFLFNCLNSIRALVVENPPRAQDMITRLANILRHNLRNDVRPTVPLSSEVDAVSDYLALESARFDDRLRVRCSVSPDAGLIPVPSMLLQTLVENAVKHGIAPRPAGGDVAIRATLDPGWLMVEVENTGQLADPTVDATQMGLSNTRGRLRILYGDRATLELANRDGDRVVATVRIPLPAPA